MSKTTELSRPERLRYHEMVGEIDENSAMLELLADYNTAAKATYGKCHDTVVMLLFLEPETGTAK